VLFSEPKIPQSLDRQIAPLTIERFSALQRAENSSIWRRNSVPDRNAVFQCSSASRKFLNPRGFLVFRRLHSRVSVLFSEPKIPQSRPARKAPRRQSAFQCSSASRKFLNPARPPRGAGAAAGFSALQRAENSSIRTRRRKNTRQYDIVSVLFSEPKIPQSAAPSAGAPASA